MAPTRRRIWWEAGPGPGGSSLTSRGKTCLLWQQNKAVAQTSFTVSQSPTAQYLQTPQNRTNRLILKVAFFIGTSGPALSLHLKNKEASELVE